MSRSAPTDLGEELLDRAEQVLGHRFRDAGLLQTALTHSSAGEGSNYQRLEFLGDRVLALVIADRLYRAFPEEPEGGLNRRFTALVRAETLAEIAGEVGLAELVRAETGGAAKGEALPPAVLGDICESAIGALYLDGGLEAAAAFIHRHWAERLRAGPATAKDAKTALQEWAQARGLALPGYRVVAQHGPDHAPDFEVAVAVAGYGEIRGRGGSKRAAEQEAAAAMLEALGAEGGSP